MNTFTKFKRVLLILYFGSGILEAGRIYNLSDLAIQMWILIRGSFNKYIFLKNCGICITLPGAKSNTLYVK